ncbi:hypothetical protein GCM10008012_19290 [Rhizobium anhuiense]|nr:hypothetical protein GCM10008012_19290 [Rhizobium anhuiense]
MSCGLGELALDDKRSCGNGGKCIDLHGLGSSKVIYKNEASDAANIYPTLDFLFPREWF